MIYTKMKQPTSYDPLRVGLIAEYMFNGNANDTSGNGLNGTVIANAALTTDRKSVANSAYNFPASGAITASRPNTNYNTISVSLWVYKAQTAIERAFHISGQDGINQDIAISFVPKSAGGGTYFGCKKTTGTIDGVKTSADLTINNWYHLVCIFNNGTFSIYVNNVLQTTVAYLNISNVASSATTIGRRTDEQQQFSGKIDDIRVWNRVLTAQEVSTLYNE